MSREVNLEYLIDRQNEKIKELSEELGSLKQNVSNLGRDSYKLSFISKVIDVSPSLKTGDSVIVPSIEYIDNKKILIFTWKLKGNTLLSQYVNITRIKKDVVTVVFSFKEDNLFLSSITSLIAMDSFAYKLVTEKEMNTLKGLGRKSLCFTIKYIVEHYKHLLKNNKIKLEASPSISLIKGDGNKLVTYYEGLGFKRVGNQTIDKDGFQYMESTFEEVLKSCSSMLSNVPSNGIDYDTIELKKDYKIE